MVVRMNVLTLKEKQISKLNFKNHGFNSFSNPYSNLNTQFCADLKKKTYL